MTETVAPDGLVPALRARGLRLAGPVGRGSGGPRWSALDRNHGRWTVTVVETRSAGHAGQVADRVQRLREIEHDHLPRHGAPLTLADGHLAVLQEEVPGADLATVCAARGPWSPAEVVTVLVPLAGALAALHARGIAHGDVSAGNVVLRPDGRAVLVDLVCGGDPAEAGTPGVAAPERVLGAGAPGDVHALARLGLRLLGSDHGTGRRPPGAAATLERRAAATLDGRAAVTACLDEASSADPNRRPGAARFASALYATCRPAPVDLPDAAVLARAALRRLAESPSAERTTWVRPRPRRERGRHRRARGRRALRLMAMAALVIVTVVAGVLTRIEAPVHGVASLGRPEGAAVRLTLARADALSSADPWALRRVTVPGSRAAGADAATAWVLRANGARASIGPDGEAAPAVARGTRARVVGVGRVPARPDGPRWDVGSCDGCARVLVTARFGLSAGSKDGGPPVTEQTVVLVLRPTRTGWRVTDVEPPP